ncbi:MAG TPA: hypothetical protein VFD37_03810 [Solirubrobacterales bacterium]|nr:hypothetical protein [Solirubrobacterales bacterium]
MRGRDLHRPSPGSQRALAPACAFGSKRALPACAIALFAVLGLLGCGGGGERQDVEADAGQFDARVVNAEIEPVQRLAKTNFMRMGIRNTGAETIPNLSVTVTLLGAEGEEAREAFQYRDPQSNIERPDRPVWIMDREFPIRLGAGESGAAGTPNPRTFAFGELEPDRVARIVWKLTPVKPGNYRIAYEVAPDIYGTGTISDERGEMPGGRLAARILKAPQRLRVTDDGRVVPIARDPGPGR